MATCRLLESPKPGSQIDKGDVQGQPKASLFLPLVNLGRARRGLSGSRSPAGGIRRYRHDLGPHSYGGSVKGRRAGEALPLDAAEYCESLERVIGGQNLEDSSFCNRSVFFCCPRRQLLIYRIPKIC